MKYLSVTTLFMTDKVNESRDFYVKYFDAKVTFDNGWYVDLNFGREASSLHFMSPQGPQHKLSKADGLSYNFKVMNVDGEYDRLTAAGLKPVLPLEDHPWGDRGFAVEDPNGIQLYIYSDIEPAEEFKKYYKK
jgi:uncharacterized glyoxalase superfamily protein PhnB